MLLWVILVAISKLLILRAAVEAISDFKRIKFEIPLRAQIQHFGWSATKI